jgi:hypothetical protein
VFQWPIAFWPTLKQYPRSTNARQRQTVQQIPGTRSRGRYFPKLKAPPDEFVPDWLDLMDQRPKSMRVLRERVATLENDLSGGEPATLSWFQKRLALHAVWLDCVLERLEADLLRGTPLDVAKWAALTGTLSRIARVLGVERQSKDVTPNLLGEAND